MPAEGMVHALEMIYALLIPDGDLIDIHPTGEKPVFEVCGPDGSTLCGVLLETDGGVEYTLATAALAHAVQAGWFKPAGSDSFTFTTHADSPAELFKYLEQQWSDAVVLPEVIDRVEQSFAAIGAQAKVHLTESVTISRYNKLTSAIS